MTKQKEITILSANLNFFCSENNPDKTSQNIVNFLLSEDRPKPTFIALQETGNRLIFYKSKEYENSDRSVNINQIEQILNNTGYGVVRPLKDGGNPVNTRLFYFEESIESIEKLPPVYNDYYCRQTGGLFRINNKTIATYSIHFPLYGNDPTAKEEMWNSYISFAKSNDYDYIALAGDYNECIINKTELYEKIEEISNFMVDASKDEITFEKIPQRKLDHLFVSPTANITDCQTIENPYSDHKALLATFTI